MRKIFTLVVLVFITSLAIAQSNYQDVVYLKNGSIIRGIIIEQVPNQSIKIETADKSIWVFQIDEVEKFTKEPVQGRRSVSPSQEFAPREQGFFTIAELGYDAGVGFISLNRIRMNIIHSYQFTPTFSAGLGTGGRFYTDSDILILPVFTDVRAILMQGPVSPYLAMGLGYSFDTSNRFEGVGIIFNPSAGVALRVSEKNTFNFGIGFDLQQIRSRYLYNLRSVESGAISFTTGITF